MYKWLAAGLAIGFGLGLIFICTLFENALSSFGNPLTVDTLTWDWIAQTNNWKFIGIMWTIAGLVALYILFRVREKANPASTPSSKPPPNPSPHPSPNPQKDSENIIVK